MSTKITNKIFTTTMGGTSATAYIGRTGEIFYDVDGTTPLRLSNGVTPGGIAFGIATTSVSYNCNFTNTSGQTLSGTVVTANYVKQGLIVHLRMNVEFGATTEFGHSSSGYVFTLPFPAVATVSIRGGSLHQTAGTNAGIYHIAGVTDLDLSSSVMRLYYSGGTSDLPWRSVTPVGVTNNNAHFDISGAYETSSLSPV
jgi:hypothetical protein